MDCKFPQQPGERGVCEICGRVVDPLPENLHVNCKSNKPNSVPLLGDSIEAGLTLVGITSERVTRWLGKPCGCPERRDKLNQLDSWARRVAKGKTEKAKEYLHNILDN